MDQNEIKTKDRIAQVALELFSRDGYEAVSVSQIAQELDMTKGALYKHFANKRDIFDSIVDSMEQRHRQTLEGLEGWQSLMAELPQRFRGTGLDRLCAITLAQFIYWVQDKAAVSFRRILSLERYRDKRMESLYQRYFGFGPLTQARQLLEEACSQAEIEADPQALALEFYSPVYALICMCDGGSSPRLAAERLRTHMEGFVRRLDAPVKMEAPAEDGYLPPLMRPIFPRAGRYRREKYMSLLTGPDPLVLGEELLQGHHIRSGGRVCDLGCGKGLSSIFLAREYGFKVSAMDPWEDSATLAERFAAQGLEPDMLTAIEPKGRDLPFTLGYLDAVISLGSYHQFGQDKSFIAETLLPAIRPGGYIYIAMPGLSRDFEGAPPRELLLAWNPDQLELLHDIHYWRAIFSSARGCDLLTLKEMDCAPEAWQTWLDRDDPYARADRRAMEAGAGRYIRFIKAILRKR